MRLLTRTVPLLVVAGLLGCRTATDPTTTPLQAGGDFTIGITAGTTPTFSWAGANANTVAVNPANVGGFIPTEWEIHSTGQIRSPVQYGSRPTGSSLVGGPRALVKGTPYRVTVYRSDMRSAYREFIP